jgi:serine protease Do
VVGINTAKLVDASNIGFALAIDNILPLIEDLREGNGDVTADTPTLGVSAQPLAGADLPPELMDQLGITEQAGLLVYQVTPGSSAEEAGIQQGDVIREADGQVTDTTQALQEVIRAKAIGDTLTITLDRMGQRQEAVATLA